ncbi:unnamed protein product [Ilex paraguariensis]|uniref:Uncharacterized protein n=1 Tax=Ilex paraguariensis TaxID=185542 RepID=A0ABC8SE55_9AQUA
MQAMQSQLDEQFSRHKTEMEAKQLKMEAQPAQMEKQMSQMEAKFEAQQRQFEVFLVQMRAMGMLIPEPARKNTNPLPVEKVPDASSTHNINSHRSSMRSESRSLAVRDTEFRGHSRASSFGQVPTMQILWKLELQNRVIIG